MTNEEMREDMKNNPDKYSWLQPLIVNTLTGGNNGVAPVSLMKITDGNRGINPDGMYTKTKEENAEKKHNTIICTALAIACIIALIVVIRKNRK